MFEFSKEYEFEAVRDDRPNVIIPIPAPRCKLAIRKDNGSWSVATGAFFKRVSTDDGTTFRDADGGIWRLIATDHRENCMIREFDGCRCKSADECQSFNAELERRSSSRKSQRDAEATVRAKQAAERAVLVVLAVISIAAFLGAIAHTLIKTETHYQQEARI